MLWERNQSEKEANNRVDPVIATALNDSQRGSGAQSDVHGFADSLPRDTSEVSAHNNRLISSSGDDEFTMYKQTNNTKVSSNAYVQSTGGNEQKRNQFNLK